MPKLYNHAGGWQIPGQQDRKAERVDVPSSPPELAAWLNERSVPLQPCNTQLASEPDGERFWERGPATAEPPSVPSQFIAEAKAGVEFVPVTRAAAIAASYGGCPKCHRTWLAQVLAGIADAPLDELQSIGEAIKQHVAGIGARLDEGGAA